MNKRLRTPLRYPGGKSKATGKMAPYFPPKDNVKHYREPFLGGGSVALWMTQNYDLETVWVNDLYWPLYNFWIQLRDDGDNLSETLIKIKTENDTVDKTKITFVECNARIDDENLSLLDRAAAFWLVNKCSFGGLINATSFSKAASQNNFTVKGAQDLKEYSKIIKDWKITNQSYETLLDSGLDDDTTFIYLDPPYEISSNLYGKKGAMHKGFDHDLFAQHCNQVMGPNIAISYNADQSVKDRFPKELWNHHEFPLTYTMRSNSANYRKNQPKRLELLLTDYD